MSLKDYEFELAYDANEPGVNVLNQFYIPSLTNSIKYDRVASYFRSSVFIVNAPGIKKFIENGGVIRMILNVKLDQNDAEAIESANDNPESFLDKLRKDEFNDIINNIHKERYTLLAMLIASGRLKIKISYVKGNIEHSKYGIFTDEEGDKVAFTGSINESIGAWTSQNNEFSVYCSWKDVMDKQLEKKSKSFERLWGDSGSKAKVYTFSDALKNGFIDTLSEKEINYDDDSIRKYVNKMKPDYLRTVNNDLSKEPSLPHYIENLFDYQSDAYDNWVKNNYIGFFKMATGTGKTITALNCALKIYQKFDKVSAVVIAPTISLCEQWKEEISSFNFPNIKIANSNNKNWTTEILNLINRSKIMDRSFFVVVTYATFNMDKFQTILSKMPEETILIADEAHNFGSEQNIKKMPEYLSKRIGLSATPDRYFDDQGTKNIVNYFGCEIGSYTQDIDMKMAIEKKYLSDYTYYPVIVELTDDEMEAYKEITRKILSYYSSSSNKLDYGNSSLEILLLQRKRIIHKAYNKKDAFRNILSELIEENPDLKYTLVFVPEGRIDSHEEDYDRLINDYSEIIHSEYGLSQHQFIGNTKDRGDVIKRFSNGEISVITAMKCLDEGIDIKRAEFGVFLSSTGNPRQFIQRRGRLLRKHPKKNFAKIYDMIVIPKINNENDEVNKLEKNIIKSELLRVYDFADTSLNTYDALNTLNIALQDYGIDIYDLKEEEDLQV